MNLNYLLDEITVSDVDEHHAEVNALPSTMVGWHFVSDPKGIRAYFETEKDAFAFRLFIINATLNDVSARLWSHHDDIS